MTTKTACLRLGCSASNLQRMFNRGLLRKTFIHRNKIDWNEDDVNRAAGYDPRTRYTVIYARTQPIAGNNVKGRTARERLEEQKLRVTEYCNSMGWSPDLIIGEVRRLNRMVNEDGTTESVSTLFQMVAEKRIGRLVIETPDRLMIGTSWALFRAMLQAQGTEVHIVNQVHSTTESRDESKGWLEDMLLMHKVLMGEVRDEAIKDAFTRGVDEGAHNASKRLAALIDAEEREQRRAARAGVRRERHPVDLDEVFGPPKTDT